LSQFRIALDHEGIYRKNGGNSQSKLITQLFERGDYSTFDLLDMERFNDISSVTSVLKSYFRTLPNPLLTFVLHDEFMFASSIRDPIHKSTKYADLVKQLPTEHYYTLRALMLHLHRFVAPTHHTNFFLGKPSLTCDLRSQDSRTQRDESDDGAQPWRRLWTYVSPLFANPPAHILLSITHTPVCSYADALPQSRGRIQRHGRQGADHRMARRKRTHDFPTIIHDALAIRGLVVPSISFVLFFFFFLDLLFYTLVACCRPFSTFCLQCVSIAALRLFSLTYIPIFLSALGFS